MRRRTTNLTLTAALCASLMMHGLVFDALVEHEAVVLARTIHQPPFDLRTYLDEHRPPDVGPVTEPEPPPPPPVALEDDPVQPKPDTLEEELFGERGSKGKALNSSAGEQAMQMREGPQEQASLSPRPGAPSDSGDGGDGGKPRQASAAASAQDVANRPPGETVAAAVPFGVLRDDKNGPFGLPLVPAPSPVRLPPKPFRELTPPLIGVPVRVREAQATTRSAVTREDSAATQPADVEPTTRPNDVAKAAPPTTSPVTDPATTRPAEAVAVQVPKGTLAEGKLPPATQQALEKVPTTLPVTPPPLTAVASVDGVRPMDATLSGGSSAPVAPTPPAPASSGGSPGKGPAGEVGNQSDSESDAFSDHPTFVYRDGKVEARDGRKVKTVRPKLTEAGRLALLSMDTPVIIIRVDIDDHGKVTGADYIRKSGMPEVDLPHLRAALDWEFEPSHDKLGRPKADTLIIPFVWH